MITITYHSHEDMIRAEAHSKCGFVTATLGDTKEEAKENLVEALTAFYNYPVKIKDESEGQIKIIKNSPWAKEAIKSLTL